MAASRISCQQFLLQPSEEHTSQCTFTITNKLRVMKGRQTKSALIAAESAIFSERVKLKLFVYTSRVHTQYTCVITTRHHRAGGNWADARSQSHTCVSLS